MAKLLAHIEQRSEAEQTAVIDGNRAYRDYLGIRNPKRLSRMLLPFRSSSPSSRISDLDAPAALVMAATRSGKQDRVMRALGRLDESLEKARKNNPRELKKIASSALGKLAEELNKGLANDKPSARSAYKLSTDTKGGLKKAMDIIGKYVAGTDTVDDANALENIISFANNAMKSGKIGEELKGDLDNLKTQAGLLLFNLQEHTRQAAERTSKREKMRLNRISQAQKNSPPVRFQGESSNLLEKSGSFKVRTLENDIKEPGRVAIFGTRINPVTHQETDLLAPFHRGFEKLEIAMMHSFVRCADGEIRRFPGAYELSANLQRQIESGKIYDSDKKHIVTHVAGYKFNPEEETGAFEVNGVKQKPIFKRDNTEVYKLGQDHHMVPQPTSKTCSFACENMLLMDQGYLRPDKPTSMHDVRRSGKSEIDSIKTNTGGVEPITFDISFKLEETNSDAIKDLQKKIERWGPCIISAAGHDRMLDEIREEEGQYLFRIRDPFHGTCNVIKGQQALFISTSSNDKVNKDLTLEVIFLPRKTASGANSQEA